MATQPTLDNLFSILKDISQRLKTAEILIGQGLPQFSNSTRPTASDVEGAIIYNTDTNKHQGSDGTTWNDLY